MKNYQQKLAVEEHDPRMKAASVTKYMARDLITFTPDTPISEAINTLLEHQISGAPVLNTRQEVVGVIDDKDCINVMLDSVYHNQPVGRNTVRNYMSKVMMTISNKANLVEVANHFTRTNFKRLLVIDDDGKLVGQISRRDVVRAIKDMDSTTWHRGG